MNQEQSVESAKAAEAKTDSVTMDPYKDWENVVNRLGKCN